MDRKEKAKYKWKEIYSYIVPSVITAGYFVCIILAEKGKIEVTLMQQSKYFEKMLESLITFMSVSYTHLDVYKRQFLYSVCKNGYKNNSRQRTGVPLAFGCSE